jgi:hypothetical protein
VQATTLQRCYLPVQKNTRAYRPIHVVICSESMYRTELSRYMSPSILWRRHCQACSLPLFTISSLPLSLHPSHYLRVHTYRETSFASLLTPTLLAEQWYAAAAPGVLPLDASLIPAHQPPASLVIPPAQHKMAPAAEVASQDHQRRRKSRSKAVFSSPFKDCLESFGKLAGPRYRRPTDGKVNGYIKFNWPRGGLPQSTSSVVDITNKDTSETPKVQSGSESYHRYSSASSDESSSSGPVALSPSAQTSEAMPLSTSSPGNIIASPVYDADASLMICPIESFCSSYLPSPPINWQTPALFSSGMTEAPRLVPPHFGHSVTMDNIDRKLWGFCKSNFSTPHPPRS